MRYLSVCSGIEAATVAWHNLGWTPVGFSEIEPFPSAVLAHHYPNVPNFGDMTKHEQWPLQPGSIDLLVGGTPCQSFSVAGLRKGLHDPRGGLMLTYLEIARRLRPRWVVWENVPGVLSSNGGRDFGSFLGAMGLLGYGVAYRVLDAQWCRTHGHPRAVPQRRRRVFVVGCLGDGERAAKVLFERESVQRDSAPRRAKGQGAPADAEAGDGAGCITSHDVAWVDGQVNPTLSLFDQGDTRATTVAVAFAQNQVGEVRTSDVSGTLNTNNNPSGRNTPMAAVAFPINTLTLGGRPDAVNDKRMTMGIGENGDPQFTLQAAHSHAVAHAFYSTGGTHGVNQQPEVSPAVKVGSGLGIPSPPAVAFSDTSSTLKGGSGERGYPDPSDGNGHSMVGTAMTVRRLTPRECERLQGFPDDYTLIPWRKKTAADCPDGPRYKALGNSMAVNCMAWIGERIAAVDAEMGTKE